MAATADLEVTSQNFILSTESNNLAQKKVHLSKGLGIRHLQCFLLFCAISLALSMRVNLSVAIVAMTDRNSTNPDFPEYHWSQRTKAKVLSSFFCGYIIAQIPSGHWARRFGGKAMILGSMLISSILAILTPWAPALGDWPLLCTLRFLQGLAQGCIFPSTHTLLSKWAPVEERGTLATCCYSGSQFGTVIMLATSGVLASSGMGWPSVFYLPGIMGLIWAICWIIWAANSPRDCKRISPAERDFIEASLMQSSKSEQNKAALKVPWMQIVKSVPFLVLLTAHCGFSWGFWTLLTQIPTYMKSILHKDIKSNALLSALPYFAMLIMGFALCPVAHVIEQRKWLSLRASRKFFNTIGQWIPMLALIAFSYVDAEHSDLAVALLTIAMALSSATHLGFQVNHIDLSPNFAGTLLGMTNSMANVMSVLAPLVVGYVVTDTQNAEQWRIVSRGFYFTGNFLFVMFGKAEVQPWNQPPEMEKEMTPLNEMKSDKEKQEIENNNVES